MFEPLKITAFFQCGVICDAHLPIDSVLYELKVREQIGHLHVVSSPGSSIVPDNLGAVNVPLQKKNRNVVLKPDGYLHNYTKDNINLHGYKLPDDERPCWYYAASFAQWNGTIAEDSSHWTKRFDVSESHLIDFGNKKAQVVTARGAYKGYRMPVFYRHAISADWYVMGIKDEIENLLRFATHLGKKASQGHGAVLRWEVEPFHSDYSVYSPSGLMRAIPKRDGILHGIRPSYWVPKHQFPCILPNPSPFPPEK